MGKFGKGKVSTCALWARTGPVIARTKLVGPVESHRGNQCETKDTNRGRDLISTLLHAALLFSSVSDTNGHDHEWYYQVARIII